MKIKWYPTGSIGPEEKIEKNLYEIKESLKDYYCVSPQAFKMVIQKGIKAIL